MQYAQVPIARMPVNLICLENGSVMFAIVMKFKTIFDLKHTEGKAEIAAMFDMESFEVGGKKYLYNVPYHYKKDENLLSWLKAQNL